MYRITLEQRLRIAAGTLPDLGSGSTSVEVRLRDLDRDDYRAHVLGSDAERTPVSEAGEGVTFDGVLDGGPAMTYADFWAAPSAPRPDGPRSTEAEQHLPPTNSDPVACFAADAQRHLRAAAGQPVVWAFQHADDAARAQLILLAADITDGIGVRHVPPPVGLEPARKVRYWLLSQDPDEVHYVVETPEGIRSVLRIDKASARAAIAGPLTWTDAEETALHAWCRQRIANHAAFVAAGAPVGRLLTPEEFPFPEAGAFRRGDLSIGAQDRSPA